MQIFFALSGFVILRSFAPGASIASYLRFLGLRCLRIYPAFLVSLTVGIAYAAWLSGASAVSVNRVVANLLFLNGMFSLGVVPYNYVTRSLFYGFVFYIAFPLLFVAARGSLHVGRTALLLWAVFVALLALASFRDWFFFMPFLVGAAAGIQRDDTLQRIAGRCPPRALLTAYLALTTVAFLGIPPPKWTASGLIWPGTEPIFAFALAVVVTLVIIGAAHGRGAMRRGLTFAPLVALGRISFSFFLLHALILHALFTNGHWFVEPSLRSFVGLLVVGFAMSWVFAWSCIVSLRSRITISGGGLRCAGQRCVRDKKGLRRRAQALVRSSGEGVEPEFSKLLENKSNFEVWFERFSRRCHTIVQHVQRWSLTAFGQSRSSVNLNARGGYLQR